MYTDHKKAAEMILGPSQKQDKSVSEEADPLHSAAQEIMDAHESKDPARVKDAYKNFFDIHQGGPGDDTQQRGDLD